MSLREISEYNNLCSRERADKSLNNLKGQFGQWLFADCLLRSGVADFRAPWMNGPDNHKGPDFIVSRLRALIEVKFYVDTRYLAAIDQIKSKFWGFSDDWKKIVLFLGRRPDNWWRIERQLRIAGIEVVWADVSDYDLHQLTYLLSFHRDRFDFEDAMCYIPAFKNSACATVYSYLQTALLEANCYTPIFDNFDNVFNPSSSARNHPSSKESVYRQEITGCGDPPEHQQRRWNLIKRLAKAVEALLIRGAPLTRTRKYSSGRTGYERFRRNRIEINARE